MKRNTLLEAAAALLAVVYLAYLFFPTSVLPTGAAVYVETLRSGAGDVVSFDPGLPEYRLVVLTDSSMASCDAGEIVGYLEELFAGIKVAYVELDSETGRRLVEKHSLSTVPAYVMNLGVEESPNFPSVSNAFSRSADGYKVKLDEEYVCMRI